MANPLAGRSGWVVALAAVLVIELAGLGVLSILHRSTVTDPVDWAPRDDARWPAALRYLLCVAAPLVTAGLAAVPARRAGLWGLPVAAGWIVVAVSVLGLGGLGRDASELLRMGVPLQLWMLVGAAVTLAALPPPAQPLGAWGAIPRAVVVWGTAVGVVGATLGAEVFLVPPGRTSVGLGIVLAALPCWLVATAAAGALPKPVEVVPQCVALAVAGFFVPFSMLDVGPAVADLLAGRRVPDPQVLVPVLVVAAYWDLAVVLGWAWVFVARRIALRRAELPS